MEEITILGIYFKYLLSILLKSTNSGGVISQTHINTESRTNFTAGLRNYSSSQNDKCCF